MYTILRLKLLGTSTFNSRSRTHAGGKGGGEVTSPISPSRPESAYNLTEDGAEVAGGGDEMSQRVDGGPGHVTGHVTGD